MLVNLIARESLGTIDFLLLLHTDTFSSSLMLSHIVDVACPLSPSLGCPFQAGRLTVIDNLHQNRTRLDRQHHRSTDVPF